MRPARRVRVARAVAILAVTLVTVSACTGDNHAGDHPAAGPTPTATAANLVLDRSTFQTTVDSYLSAWKAAWLDPANAQAKKAVLDLTGDAAFADRLIDVGKTIEVAGMDVTEQPGHGPECQTSTRCRQALSLRVAVKGVGDAHWTSSLGAVQAADGWQVLPDPESIHPDLSVDTRLRRVRQLPDRAPILDRDGHALMSSRPVVHVGLEEGRATPAAARQLARKLQIDPGDLIRKLKAAGSHQFVEALVLRQGEYDQLKAGLGGVRGLAVIDGRRSLAVNAQFGRSILGIVAPATAETLRNAGPDALASDEVGAFGLQFAFQQRLAGRPTTSIRIVSPATGKTVATLARSKGRAGTPLRTTLQTRAQRAAENALDQAPGKARVSIVAVQASTGQVLAAANGQGLVNEDRAFTGRYAPGSTFKIVSTAALLSSGMTPRSSVNCTDHVVVDGATFGNYDALLAPGRTTLAHAVSLSCNTAFIGQRNRVAGTALPTMARAFGIGVDWKLPLDAWSGDVPEPAGQTELAASMIGQGRITVSPLAMAEVAAAVRSGRAHRPTLLSGSKAAVGPGIPQTRALRAILADTATNGTAKILAGLADGAKTGTAETGSKAKGAATNAWMVGYAGDLAFAVIVEGGSSGAHVAGPVAKAFLTEYQG
jgi:cell division protein FtsI/penicillin-binding protein 2